MKNNLSVEPQDIDEHNWYYEEKKGIALVHQVLNDAGRLVQTDHILIPWKMIDSSNTRRHSQRN